MKKTSIENISKVLKTGKTPPSKNDAYFIHDYNWYTPGDIQFNKYLTFSERGISQKALDDKKSFLYPENSLLITCIGNIGRVGISKERSASNQQITAIKPNEELDVEFLYYWFIKNQEVISYFANNAVVPILNNQTLKRIEISYPPLKTQQEIVEILDAAAALRDHTKKLLEEYDLLAQSIFLDMFGEPGLLHDKTSFIPLNELIVQKPDNGFFAKKDFYNEDGVPIVWLNNFIDKLYIDQDNLRRAKTKPKDDKYALEYGDALFCRSSLTSEGIGKCAIVPKGLKEKVLFECHIIRLKFNLLKIVPEYFRYLSDTLYFRANINKSAKTSTMTTISQDGITKISIPVPPITLQNQFAKKIEIIEQQKALAKQELLESKDLFQALLQRAFKGELV